MKSNKLWIVAALLGCFGLVGCSPKPLTTLNQVPPISLAKTDAEAWPIIQTAIQKGLQLHQYQIKASVNLVDNSINPSFTVYGSVEKPNEVSLGVHEGDTNIQFFQQGQSAFSFVNGHWAPSDPLPSPDVFQTYAKVLEGVEKMGTPVYLQPQQYVVDEYCWVFTMIVPGVDVEKLATWDAGEVFPASSHVLMTVMVGKRSGQIREVETSSVGSISEVGPIQISTDTILFNLNKKYAKVNIPLSLVKQFKD
ncbi:hypothetical protein FY534_08735 [Alicyclobacillus sp. TC]|uniref:hypothetical protein n=1 Tax=Alicyclobacillus sp. TC TaxID=2606450 RepID=UPI001934416F|nr:hypothetical protein [Alicyclobacillus sp. TC]QRF23739.1 hypothetical protein FY534_08735 [Alicyclobacillus sp. TC]